MNWLGRYAKHLFAENSFQIEKKIQETDRRDGKGRRCCLGDGIHSIPSRTRDLAPGL